MRHPSLTSMLLALPAACGAEDPGAPPYRHLLLISLDTTRADHIGCYERCEGVSLVPAMEGLEFERGPVFVGATQPFRAEREDGWTNREKPVCVRDGPWKYVRSRYNKVEQLFHLGRDPREQNDLLRNDLRPRAAQRLAALRAALDAWEASATPLPTKFDFENAEETRRRLQGLGYSGEDS